MSHELPLQRLFGRAGLTPDGWVDEVATVTWEAWRGLHRLWGENPGAPWANASHLDQEITRASVWVDLLGVLELEKPPALPPLRRQRVRARVRQAVLYALFPEELYVDGDLPRLSPPDGRRAAPG